MNASNVVGMISFVVLTVACLLLIGKAIQAYVDYVRGIQKGIAVWTPGFILIFALGALVLPAGAFFVLQGSNVWLAIIAVGLVMIFLGRLQFVSHYVQPLIEG